MSILTKTLIVLLAFSSFFLCASVVTYVATADNYKQKYTDLRSDRDSLKESVKSLTKQVNEKIYQNQKLEEKLNNQIASLGTEIAELQGDLNTAEREKGVLEQKVNNWVSITKDFYETNDKQRQLFENTFNELNRVKAEQIKERKELDDTTAALIEKMAIIETLETKNRRLLEEKFELQSRLDQLLQQFGKEAVVTEPVTPEKDKAREPMPPARDIGLKGLITVVDLKNKMASISIGKADGVKEGMKFHVTRGDQFLCDILIIDVDTEEAAGVLELVQQNPKVGDNVSTNL